MLEAYTVGVTLDLNGNAVSGVDRLIAVMDTLERAAQSVNGVFAKMAANIREVSTAGRAIGRLNTAMEKLNTIGVGGAVGSMEKMAEATAAAVASSERLMVVLRDNAKLMADMAANAAAAARATGRGIPGNAPGGGGGGGVPGRRRDGGGGHGADGFTGHDALQTAIGTQLVAEPLLHGAESAFDRAIEVAHLRAQIMSDQRVTAAQADALVKSAYDATTTAPGSRVTENMHALIDLKSVTGSLDEAQKMLPAFAALSNTLAVLDKRKGGTGAFAAAKAMELLGGMIDEKTDASGATVREINPELLQRRLDAMTRVAVATNGRVAPQDYLGFAKQARIAGMTLSDEFIYEKLPAMLMAMGGPRAGTALMSMAQVFRGDKLTDKSMGAMISVGLASPMGITTEINPHTGQPHAVVHPEAVFDRDLMAHDPSQYVAAAQKRMEAAGIHGTEDQITALLRVSQRATIAGFLADVLKDAPVIAKEQANIQATRPDVAAYFASQDPAAKVQQMQSAFDKLMTTMGGAAMGDAVSLMNAVTSGLNGLSAWAEKNPGIARVLTDTAAGLGALGVALGTLSGVLLAFGPALRLLGIVGAGGAAAGGGGAAAAAAGGASTLIGRVIAGGFSAGGLALGGLAYGVVKGGSMNEAETKGAQQQLEELHRSARKGAQLEPVDGFGDGSGPAGRSVTASPVTTNTTINLQVPVQIDGREVANAAISRIVRGGTGPSSGTTGADISAGTYGGNAGLSY